MELAARHHGRYISYSDVYSPSDAAEYADFAVDPLFDEYYRRILGLCRENEIAVHLVKLPLPDNAVFSDAYRASFAAYYDGLKEEFPEISVEWFENYPAGCFYDLNHMNSRGAFRFTTELREDHGEEWGGSLENDFSPEYFSAEQMMALDDYLEAEDQIDWIVKWAGQGDYTVLLWDRQGLLVQGADGTEEAESAETYYAGMWGIGRLEPYGGETSAEERRAGDEADSGIYCVNVETGNIKGFSVAWRDGKLWIQPEGKDALEWTTVSDDALGLMVFDNVNGTVACMKSFLHVPEGFVMAEE